MPTIMCPFHNLVCRVECSDYLWCLLNSGHYFHKFVILVMFLEIILGGQNCIHRICNEKCYSNCRCTNYSCYYDNCPFNYIHTSPFNFSKLNVLKFMVSSYAICWFLIQWVFLVSCIMDYYGQFCWRSW